MAWSSEVHDAPGNGRDKDNCGYCQSDPAARERLPQSPQGSEPRHAMARRAVFARCGQGRKRQARDVVQVGPGARVLLGREADELLFRTNQPAVSILGWDRQHPGQVSRADAMPVDQVKDFSVAVSECSEGRQDDRAGVPPEGDRYCRFVGGLSHASGQHGDGAPAAERKQHGAKPVRVARPPMVRGQHGTGDGERGVRTADQRQAIVEQVGQFRVDLAGVSRAWLGQRRAVQARPWRLLAEHAGYDPKWPRRAAPCEMNSGPPG